MEKQYGSITIDEDILKMMTDEAIRRSGYNNKYSAEDNGTAIPAIAYGRGWGGYDRFAIGDIARILLLQQIFGGRRRPHWRRRNYYR